MKREISVEWTTEITETDSEWKTKITLINDDSGFLWFEFNNGDNREYARCIPREDIVKLSRFFYDAADFIKMDS